MLDFTSKDPLKDFFADLETLTAPFWETVTNEAKQSLRKFNKTVVDNVLTLETDLPGVKKKDLNLNFSELTAGGTRIVVVGKRGEEEVKFGLTIKESLLASEAKAELSNGVLKITAPIVAVPDLKVTEIKIS